jgi:hypothetical protein
MNHTVPPSFDLEESSFVSFVGVGMREVVIVGGGLILGILAGLALPLGWPVKIGAGTLLCAFGVWLAIGREPGSNRTFEEVFLDFIRFQRRPKVHQRHYQPTPEGDPFSSPDVIRDAERGYKLQEEEPSLTLDQDAPAEGDRPVEEHAPPERPQHTHDPQPTSQERKQVSGAGWDVSQLPELDTLTRKKGWFKIRSMPLTPASLLNVLGIALLAGILAWVWMGGLEAAIARFSGF